MLRQLIWMMTAMIRERRRTNNGAWAIYRPAAKRVGLRSKFVEDALSVAQFLLLRPHFVRLALQEQLREQFLGTRLGRNHDAAVGV